MESPWCHRCTQLVFEGQQVECNFRDASPCDGCAQHEEQTGERILCEPTMATLTTKTEYDEMERMIDEQARMAAQLYATPDGDSEERSSDDTMKSASESPGLKRSAGSASLDGSDDEPYSPRHIPSPPPPSKRVRFGCDFHQAHGLAPAKQPKPARDLFPHKLQQSGRLNHQADLINMSGLLPQEYRDKRNDFRNNIMGDQRQVKLLTQSQLIYQLKHSLQKEVIDSCGAGDSTDSLVFEQCDRKLIGWNPTHDPDRARLRKEKLEARIQQQKAEIGKLERQLRQTSRTPRACPYYRLGRCQFGDKCKWVHPRDNSGLFPSEDLEADTIASGLAPEAAFDGHGWSETTPDRSKIVDEQTQNPLDATDNARVGQPPTVALAAFQSAYPPSAGDILSMHAQGQAHALGLAQLLQSVASNQSPAHQPSTRLPADRETHQPYGSHTVHR